MTEYIFSGGSVDWRYQVRNDRLYLDVELTATGFAGIEGLDWKAKEMYQ